MYVIICKKLMIYICHYGYMCRTVNATKVTALYTNTLLGISYYIYIRSQMCVTQVVFTYIRCP